VTSHSPRFIASANARTTGVDNGRLVVFASSNSAALFGVMLCTLLRTRVRFLSSSIRHRLRRSRT
jgi:hypothetical protein